MYSTVKRKRRIIETRRLVESDQLQFTKPSGNKKTRVISKEECEELITTIENGFMGHHPNPFAAFALTLEANLGMRISDIVNLTTDNFQFEFNRFRLYNVTEEKTSKVRDFTVPDPMIEYIKDFCEKYQVKEHESIVGINTRAVQKILKSAADYLGYEGIGTHSFRKFYATSLYEITKDPLVVQTLMQHSSWKVTQRYIGIQDKNVESALKAHLLLPQKYMNKKQ